ncbi:MAG: twin-arginine translocase TatA/TatE family subunit [Dehalococcoidia bacterium]|nr:twin-arginine translocase TatA/TatE family subunit [Dehalococcoidia bacterium]
MDFLGIGVLELLVILLIAVVVLGPAGTVKGARSIGRMLGEVRRSMTDLSKAVEAEERELENSINRPEPVDRRGPEEPGPPR